MTKCAYCGSSHLSLAECSWLRERYPRIWTRWYATDDDVDVEPDYGYDEPDTRTEHDWTL